MPALRLLLLGLCSLWAGAAVAQQNPDGRLPIGNLGDPTVLLLRDDVVLRELQVTDGQQKALRELADRLDLLFWPTRNQSREVAAAGWSDATQTARREAAAILTTSQMQRLDEIILRVQGTRGLLRDDVAGKLGLDDARRTAIREITDKTAGEIVELSRRASDGEPAASLERQRVQLLETEQRQVVRKLTEQQRQRWAALIGKTFDVSRLGRVDFHAPELIAAPDDWINGPVPSDHRSRRVTAVHFFANGCINCIHNYEHYQGWDRDFREQGLVIVGIHTPETKAEHDRTRLQQKVAEAGFQFPILIDNDLKNWNAWGNTMWPSVYLVDHQGRIRYWWYGELNWQGNDGENRLRKRIEELLAESPSSAR